ncbi:hypothetical protein GCM10012275_61450 [Longimycelium tulufanense]|uniref:Uncharacterized protein n=1 Tax=Longimycelium tulufanense TaxID=907463 RepID=A0A8J3CKI2_9PSEU|nr:hypothetical protein [Longimycelium tulufanense]GGM82592.1 hypothetical protein GCM10012275_61450 [Longimycelium tulufanense]
MFSTILRRLRLFMGTTTPTPDPTPHAHTDWETGPGCIVCQTPGNTCAPCDRFVSECEWCGGAFVGVRRCCAPECRMALGIDGRDDPWRCGCCRQPLDRAPRWLQPFGEPYDRKEALCQGCYTLCDPITGHDPGLTAARH